MGGLVLSISKGEKLVNHAWLTHEELPDHDSKKYESSHIGFSGIMLFL